VQASHALAAVFDEENLVSPAGLVPVLGLADRSGLAGLLADLLTVPSPNAGVKARTVIAGMLAGADDIDGLDVLRCGGTARVIAGVRAPSTIGTFLRRFTHGRVLQLGAVNRRLVEALAADIPGVIGPDGLVLVDMDDTIRRLYGYGKQAAAYGYSGIKGLNGLLATISTDTTPPVITDFGLRRGNARSGDSAGWYAARTLATVSRIAPGRRVLMRADSAFCSYDNVKAAAAAGRGSPSRSRPGPPCARRSPASMTRRGHRSDTPTPSTTSRQEAGSPTRRWPRCRSPRSSHEPRPSTSPAGSWCAA
jgi:hypothetical protein